METDRLLRSSEPFDPFSAIRTHTFLIQSAAHAFLEKASFELRYSALDKLVVRGTRCHHTLLGPYTCLPSATEGASLVSHEHLSLIPEFPEATWDPIICNDYKQTQTSGCVNHRLCSWWLIIRASATCVGVVWELNSVKEQSQIRQMTSSVSFFWYFC